MHQSVHDFVQTIVDDYNLSTCSVLDVGSMDVNGTSRHRFTGRYYGVDIRPGPCVDEVVTMGGRLPDGIWQVILCTEVLEHDIAPWRTLHQMRDAAAHEAHLIVTTRSIGFPLHDHPGDHWRISVDGMQALLRDCGWEPKECHADPEQPGVFAHAVRL